MSVEVKEISQLDSITVDENTLIPVYSQTEGIGKATLQNAKDVIGVSIDSVSASITQGNVNSNPTASVTNTGTDQNQELEFSFTVPAPNQIERTTVAEDTTSTRKQTVTFVNSDTTKNQSIEVRDGRGITGITQVSSTANGATRAITVAYSDGTTDTLSVKNGEGIDSVNVSQNLASGGTSTMTLSMSDGTTQTVSIKNGKDFHIEKSYASIAAMEADFANMDEYDFVMIDTGSVEDVDTGKLYYKGDSAWQYVGDLSGKQGIKGDTGTGISQISFTASNADSGVNILTVTLSDGTSQTFNIRNGSKGSTGERGSGFFAGTTYSETGSTEYFITTDTGIDTGLIIDKKRNVDDIDYSTYKVGDVYLQTSTKNLYSAQLYTKSSGSSAVAILYWNKLTNLALLQNIAQTTTSTASGGVNTITATLSDGTTQTFSIKNGESIGSIEPPATVDTSSGAGNVYTVKNTSGITVGTFTVYNASNTTATSLATARNFTITDADGTNSGTAKSFDGTANMTLTLPSTIKASITGNCSGSSGSCTGHAVTATTATFATKLLTARKVYVKLGTASTSETKDFSGDTAIPVNGTLGTGNGGTGATSILGILQNLRNSVTGASAGNIQSNYGIYVTASKFTTTSGYIKFSNGLLIQWGRTSQSVTTEEIALITYTSVNTYFVYTAYIDNRGVSSSSGSAPVVEKMSNSKIKIGQDNRVALFTEWLTIGY